MAKSIYLILENGRVFKGKSFGHFEEKIGEIVFNTAMTGYLETLSDPSYFGQIVVQTFPLIGNYGIIPSDFESNNINVTAYIVRERCQEPSNFRSEGDIDTFFKARGVVGLEGADTRLLTKIVREYGVMNGMITDKPDVTDEVIARIKAYKVTDAVERMGNTGKRVLGEGNKYKVTLWDFGAKENIARMLAMRNCCVTVMPASSKASDILATNPDGIMLSNGPGDPAVNKGIIEELKLLINTRVPIFGICLGHQLLALAEGARTEKLKYGHRGVNQPARDVLTGKVYMTSQNHGYTVVAESLPKNAIASFINVNDGTCEGVRYLDKPIFSVQFHPEAAGGPHDTEFLFDDFIKNMEEASNAAV